MSRIPLMPKATAVWLVENTGLTFRQIADFCHLHELEVKGIADGDVAAGIKGMDPVTGGQLTREEIEKGEKDPEYRLKILESKVNIQVQKATSGPRYTPVSRRGDRPDAIAWLLRYHPELPGLRHHEARRHHQVDDRLGARAGRTGTPPTSSRSIPSRSASARSSTSTSRCRRRRARPASPPTKSIPVRTLIPASEVEGTAAHAAAHTDDDQPTFAPSEPTPREAEPRYDADSVFAKLKPLKRKDAGEE